MIVVAPARYCNCGERFSGRSQVATNTKMLPKTKRMLTALCLFLSITNLRCSL